MSLKQKIQKIPGDILSPFKTESQGYIDNLEKKQKFQLKELLERQNKILANKKFLSKLPDKGQKIKSFCDKILKEIEHKNEVEKAAELLSRLNIASEGKTAISKLEWTGKFNKNNNETTNIVELDSDDEDPLKILAQPTGSGIHKKKIIYIASEKSLIKLEDIAEIESFKIESLNVEHVKYIIDKIEKTEEIKKSKSFKPYKTTKSNVHDPTKEKQRKLSKTWEVTAATPPLIVHGAAKVLSLTESLQLQKEQTEKLYEIQAKHAIERLTNQKLHNIGVIPQNAENYRLQEHMNGSFSSSSSNNEEEHEYDEENNNNGTVVYTIESTKS